MKSGQASITLRPALVHVTPQRTKAYHKLMASIMIKQSIADLYSGAFCTVFLF